MAGAMLYVHSCAVRGTMRESRRGIGMIVYLGSELLEWTLAAVLDSKRQRDTRIDDDRSPEGCGLARLLHKTRNGIWEPR